MAPVTYHNQMTATSDRCRIALVPDGTTEVVFTRLAAGAHADQFFPTISVMSSSARLVMFPDI